MCPLRFVLALLSLGVLVVCAFMYFVDPSSASAKVTTRLASGDRPWWRTFVALFTGELLYEWYYGRATAPEDVVFEMPPAGAAPDAEPTAAGEALPDPQPLSPPRHSAAVAEPAAVPAAA